MTQIYAVDVSCRSSDRQADGGVAVPDTGTTGMGQPGARHGHMARHRDHLARVGSVDRSGLR
ncbi:hypothetical protein H641_02093 [Cutibacterium granulosum DSM 20700]|uniref:Uncharacterized protein n=1 Tax=Cutibacterium granulosum DSM 20700 TaxID=1160719 RepID=U1FFD4_9ACTN|nr:hypothetical protein H641_02093 [Cutibacterium granulosum DSM 20700]